jgi:molybdopterin converting factor small subunit
MARVVFPEHLLRYTGNTREVEVPASTFRDLVQALDERFPGIEDVLLDRVAVAIDGEISHEPFLEPIGERAEVHFLLKISGG